MISPDAGLQSPNAAQAPTSTTGTTGTTPDRTEFRAPVLLRGRIPHLPGLTRAGDFLALLTPQPVAQVGPRSFSLDGAAICGERVLINSSDVAAVIPGSVVSGDATSLANWWSTNIANPSCLFMIDEHTQEALCLPDPLGGSLVFHYSAGGTEFISSDIVSLIRAANAAGSFPSKSVDYQLERLALGNGGLTPSSYDGVDRLDLFTYWELDPSGARRREYALAEEMRSPEVSYVQGLERVRRRVLESVVAISKMPSEFRVAHLTGGFDSRLVLAAMVEAGCTDRFSFFCSGPEGTTDRQIADGLAGVFNLQRTLNGGLTAAPASGVHERLLAPLFYSGGMTSTGPTGRELTSSVVAAGGGYGEVLRTFYGPRFRNLDESGFTGLDLMNSMVPHVPDRKKIYTSAAEKSIGTRLHHEWMKLSTSGVPTDFIGDAMYSQVRNRYHIGQNSVLWSRIGSRLDPLYSVDAYRLASSIPLEAREANVIGFDLMDTFAGDLKAYPFDRNRFSSVYGSMRRVPSPKSWGNGANLRKPTRFQAPFAEGDVLPAHLENLEVPEPTVTAEQRKEFVATANRIGVNYWQVSTLTAAQKALSTAMEKNGSNQFTDTLDGEYLKKLATTKLARRQEIRDVYSAFGLLAWLSS
ncbi:hypothetical protein ACTXMB_07515 [Arthrobacter rhombi]|uniref:hypothetical protein n=1 Tax=Arthrobacter rhombi TaxID=71253 RepID=UPI003FD4A62E